VRLDKWLWAARFFKTRAKPAKDVKVGDRVVVRRAPFEHAVMVKGLSDKRGSATVAAELFTETEESRARRTVLAAEMKALPQPRFKGRPTKKTRRDYERWLRQGDDE
jgi:ribosome-associated heat shock protein Hsp15